MQVDRIERLHAEERENKTAKMTTLPLNYDQTLEKEQQNNLVRNFARAALSCVILRTYCQNDIHKRELA
jgi:hypothetical protein